jgi:hypothetical protein
VRSPGSARSHGPCDGAGRAARDRIRGLPPAARNYAATRQQSAPKRNHNRCEASRRRALPRTTAI